MSQRKKTQPIVSPEYWFSCRDPEAGTGLFRHWCAHDPEVDSWDGPLFRSRYADEADPAKDWDRSLFSGRYDD